MTKFVDFGLRYDQTTTILIQGTQNSLQRVKTNNEEDRNTLLSLCSTLRVKHSLGGYSHREHCRAPDEEETKIRN